MKKVLLFLSFLFLCNGVLFASSQDWLKEGDKAPTFKMYEYKEKSFDLEEHLGKKIIVLVAGSIT